MGYMLGESVQLASFGSILEQGIHRKDGEMYALCWPCSVVT